MGINLKVIHPICAGIDVHKDFMTIAILTTKKTAFMKP